MRWLTAVTLLLSYASLLSGFFLDYVSSIDSFDIGSLDSFPDISYFPAEHITDIRARAAKKPNKPAQKQKPKPAPKKPGKPWQKSKTVKKTKTVVKASQKTKTVKKTVVKTVSKPQSNNKKGSVITKTQTVTYSSTTKKKPAPTPKPKPQPATTQPPPKPEPATSPPPPKTEPAPKPEPAAPPPPPAKPGTVLFDSNAIREIVDEHNKVRSLIAKGQFKDGKGRTKPAAESMMKLVWDVKLVRTAQKVSDTCVFAHSKTPDVGENLYTATSSRGYTNLQEHGKKAVVGWNDEFGKFGWTTLEYEAEVGHAVQNVWGKTHYVGCAVTSCKGGKNVLLACHYSPKGNILKKPAYTQGKTCSKCPDGSKCEQATGLCV